VEQLNKTFRVRMGRPDNENKILLTVNETLLYQDPAYIINAFKKSMM